jgi:hypothetical protein
MTSQTTLTLSNHRADGQAIVFKEVRSPSDRARDPVKRKNARIQRIGLDISNKKSELSTCNKNMRNFKEHNILDKEEKRVNEGLVDQKVDLSTVNEKYAKLQQINAEEFQAA